MRRLFALLVIAPPASAAGFHLASFVYRLVTHLSFFVASVVGTAVSGQVSADVGHVALAEARVQ